MEFFSVIEVWMPPKFGFVVFFPVVVAFPKSVSVRRIVFRLLRAS